MVRNLLPTHRIFFSTAVGRQLTHSQVVPYHNNNITTTDEKYIRRGGHFSYH